MERLKEMGQDVEPAEEPQPVYEENTRVLAGYKATLSSKYHPPCCGLECLRFSQTHTPL